MRTIYYFLTLQVTFLFAGAQQLKELKPEIGYKPDLSTHAQQQFVRRDSLLNKPKLTAKEEKELKQLLESFDETKESVWDIIGSECSWYCGGGPYKVVASSQLNNNFSAGNANDLSFKSAWVEGVKGNGEGQYIEYYFENESPRLNMIQVYNGYVKSEKAWRENGRVKRMKLLINGKPYAILALENSTALQSFKMPLLGKRADKKDLVLRFEILETYPGEKFEDTALTEIFFDGTDVH